MHGRRVTGAGDAVAYDEYVTLGQLREELGARRPEPTNQPTTDEKWERVSGAASAFLRPRVTEDRLLLGSEGVNLSGSAALLDLVSEGTGQPDPVALIEYYSDTIGGPSIAGLKGRGTKDAPTAVLSNDRLLDLSGIGFFDGSGLVGSANALLLMSAAENWSSTARGTKLTIALTQNGTTGAVEALRITDARAVELCKDLFGGLASFGNAQEELTLSTVGATTDTAASLLPANAIILAVNTRITTALTGPTTSISVGDATTATRFASAIAITLNATNVGIRHQNTSLNGATVGPAQTAAASVRITANGGTPTAGKVRISVCYLQFTAPTS
jgi:hypothetical protein